MNVQLHPDGTAEGKIRCEMTQHLALDFRENNMDTPAGEYLEKLESAQHGIEISAYTRNEVQDCRSPLTETYDFRWNKAAEVINDKLYISPMLFLAAKENPFRQEKREYPVDFGYPTEKKFNISIAIPEGYRIVSMPAPMNIESGEKIGQFKYIAGVNGSHIQVMISQTVGRSIVPSDFYNVLKDFYQQLTDKQNENIILEKI